VTFTPQTFNYHDYKNAWYRRFLLQPNIHSWFFDFHDSCSNIFPPCFYHWWIWFGCALVVFPPEANEGWDYWSKATTTMEPYMKEVQFFKQFNVAWIFCWEYRLHQYLPAPYPLSLVWYGSIKLNGGRNTKQSYVAERTWSFFAKQIPKNSRSIIYSILINQNWLLLRHPRKKAHHPPPNPKQEDYHKRNEIS